jgi:hypothetical protein
MRRPRYANECWSRLRSSRRLGLGVSVAGPALDVSPLPGASPHPPRSRAAGVSAGGNLFEPTDLEADNSRRGLCGQREGRTTSKAIDLAGGRKLRHDKLIGKGTVTLRINHQMHHIPCGRQFAGLRVRVLVEGLDISVIGVTVSLCEI